jgi:hypothetical protein
MIAAGSPLSSALAALNAVAPGQIEPAATATAPRHTGNALTGVSRLMLSPATSDALLRFTEHPSNASSATAQRHAADIPSRSDPAPSPEGIPADRVAWLNSLGAERWEVREAPMIDDASFRQQVLDNLLRNGSVKLDGFAEAHAKGTLTIQPATEVPELGYKSFQVTLYKNGEAYGGVGFSVCNTDHWMALRERGIYAGTGSVGGADYVATWPMPHAAMHAEPGTYEAA